VSASIEIDARRDFTVLSPDRRMSHTQQQRRVVMRAITLVLGPLIIVIQTVRKKGMDLM